MLPPDDLPIRDYTRDDDLVRGVQADGLPRLRVYAAPEVELVLGRGSRPERELNLPRVLADGLPVTRRAGGGCAVLLDPGNAVVALALPSERIGGIRGHFERLTRWLIEGLAAAGIAGLHRDGSSDLVLGDRKVGGSCFYQGRGVLLYAGTLLVDPRVDLMERYLAMPPREPPYRRHRPHRDFVGDLRGLGVGYAAELADRLKDSLRVPGQTAA
jgi:lipoate-protein ligase A